MSTLREFLRSGYYLVVSQESMPGMRIGRRGTVYKPGWLLLIEHIIEPAVELRQIWQRLKPGGVVYINTPNIDSASFKLFKNRHMHVSSFGHVSLFSPQSLKGLAERCGFTTVAQGCDGPIDIELHDLLTHKLTNGRFTHRMSLYSQRLFAASTMLDIATAGLLRKALSPAGNTSYRWSIFRKC